MRVPACTITTTTPITTTGRRRQRTVAPPCSPSPRIHLPRRRPPSHRRPRSRNRSRGRSDSIRRHQPASRRRRSDEGGKRISNQNFLDIISILYIVYAISFCVHC